MSDGQVIVTLSVQDAEALRAWQRSKKGIGELEQELQKAKKTTKAVGEENQKLTKTQAEGFQKLSAMGRESFQQQSSFARGLMQLDKQRQEEASAALVALKGQSLAAWGAMGEKIAAARQQTAGVTTETQKLSKTQADGFARFSAMGAKAFADQSTWSKGMASLEKQRIDAAAAASKTAMGRIRAGARGVGNAVSSATSGISELGKEISSTAASSVLGFTSVAGAVGAIVAGLHEAISATKALDAARDESTLTREESQAMFASQARSSGLSRERLAEIGRRVEIEGAPYGHKSAVSLELAREAASQGVAVEEIPAFLSVANKFAAAQGIKLDLPLFKSFVAGTRVEDDKLGVAAAERTAKAFFGSFLTRQLQPQQLEQFSRQNYGLKQAGLNVEQQIAANTAALDIYGGSAEQASTFNRAFFGKLRSAKGRSEAVKSLDQLGLRTDEVDLVGEDVHQVLDRLAAAIEVAPKEERVPLLTKIFGEEYASQAQAFVANRQKLRDIVNDIKAVEPEFEKAAAELTSTNAAKQRAFDAEKNILEGEHGNAEVETVRKAMMAEFERRGSNGFVQDLASRSFSANVFSARHFGGGLTKDKLIELAATELSSGPFGEDYEAAEKKLQEVLAPRAPTPAAKKPSAARRAAPPEAPREDQEQLKAKYAARAKDAREAAEKKTSEKEQQEEQKALDKKLKAEVAQEKRDQAARKKIESQAAAARKAAATNREYASREAKRRDEIGKEMEAKRRIIAAGNSTRGAANPFAPAKKGKKRSAPRVKSEATRIREAEAMRKLQSQFEEADRKRAEYEQKANDLMQQNNQMMAQIVANTGGKNAPARIPPQRPPAQIGGN